MNMGLSVLYKNLIRFLSIIKYFIYSLGALTYSRARVERNTSTSISQKVGSMSESKSRFMVFMLRILQF